jgi:hypothetical protein
MKISRVDTHFNESVIKPVSECFHVTIKRCLFFFLKFFTKFPKIKVFFKFKFILF